MLVTVNNFPRFSFYTKYNTDEWWLFMCLVKYQLFAEDNSVHDKYRLLPLQINDDNTVKGRRKLHHPLTLWYIPQAPMNSFNVKALNYKEAADLLSLLYSYDLFLFENGLKPDYCNVGGLLDENGDEWESEEWENIEFYL